MCSISASTVSSSSTSWLDRLHLANGFSVPDQLDLDHFLSSNPNPIHPSPPPPSLPCNPLPPAAPARRKKHSASADEQQQQLCHLMSSVLAELFVMGGPTSLEKKKKSARKQLIPRACIPAGIDGCCAPPATSPPSSADNSVAEAKKSRTKARKKRASSSSCSSGSPADLDLSAFSRSEVTVIDSSVPGWKSEKIIFRKGFVWKVRDKKVWSLGRKKRRLGLVEKLANEKEKEEILVDLKTQTAKDPPPSLNEGGAHADKRDGSEGTDERTKISSRRQKFSRSPRVPVAKDSSVFHLKVVAPGKKNGAAGPKSSLKR